MRLVGIHRVEIGSVLGRDVLSGRAGAPPLLARGTILSARYLEALERAGIHALYVEDELGKGIEVSPLLSEETRAAAVQSLDEAFGRARQGVEAGEPIPDDALSGLSELARLIADEIAQSGDAVVALQDLGAADSYTLQHSINVTALGMLIGRRHLLLHGWVDFRRELRFDKVEERLVQLGLGLMLHDIGKLILPTEILTKPGPLDETEWELVRGHPAAGLDLLAYSTVGPLARTVIRSHHERWDGGGYPDGVAGSAIHQFARIGAIADVYDAITSERPYSRARPPHVGWSVIVDGAGTAFEPASVATFRSVVAPYPPGSEIVLDDGRRGVVVSVRPGDLERPLVRIGWNERGAPVAPYELELDTLPAHTRAA